MNNFSKSARRRIVRADLYALMSTLDQFKGMPIILLYSTVLEVCGPPLRETGHCVLNDTFITPGFQWAAAAARQIALHWNEALYPSL